MTFYIKNRNNCDMKRWSKRSEIIESLYCHTPSLASGVSFIRYMILDTVTNVLYLIISRSLTANSMSEATAFRAIRGWSHAMWRKNAYYNLKKWKYNIHIVQCLLWINSDFFDVFESESETKVHGVLGRDSPKCRLNILLKFFRSFIIYAFCLSFVQRKVIHLL